MNPKGRVYLYSRSELQNIIYNSGMIVDQPFFTGYLNSKGKFYQLADNVETFYSLGKFIQEGKENKAFSGQCVLCEKLGLIYDFEANGLYCSYCYFGRSNFFFLCSSIRSLTLQLRKEAHAKRKQHNKDG